MRIPRITSEQVTLYAKALRGALGRKSLLDFYLLMRPEHEASMGWFHYLLIEKLQAFADGKIKKLMVFMPPQHGKFLKGDTPVLTTKGWKQHGDLCAGDYVFSDTGQPVAVIANSGLYDWHVNKVEFAGGEVLYAADEHLWKVQAGEDGDIDNPFIVTDTANIKTIIGAKQVSASSFCLLPNKYECDKFFFKSIESFGIVTGNCIQVEGGMYLAGESLIPTHNSELCSRILPAYLLGIKPTCRVLSTSYSADLSSKFNRDVQRLIDSPDYQMAFPETKLNNRAVRSDKNGSWLRNKDEFEIVGHGGYYKSAGVGGGITGRSCDTAIMDDLVRGAADAASPTIRERTWDWYAQDLCSRLNNYSQQLLIMTRWHEHDIAGRILKSDDGASWEVIVFPAIKENNNNPSDPRKIGEALWPMRQDLPRLRAQRKLGERKFQCLYQQDPVANKELLVYPNWQSIPELEYEFIDQTPAFGLDFGYNDEMALVEVKIEDNRLYMHQRIFQSGLVASTLIIELDRLGVPKNALIVCDNARPEMIKELRMAGYNAQACIKGPNTKLEGVTIMQDYRIMITSSSKDLIEEIDGYEYTIGPDGKPTDFIRDGKDHLMDGGRYIVSYLRKTSRYNNTVTVMDLSRDKYDNIDDRYGY